MKHTDFPKITRQEIYNAVGKNAETIIEVGACQGEDTIKFFKKFPQATIYCIEPKPENFKILRQTIRDKRVKMFHGALFRLNGTAELFCSNSKYRGASSLKEPSPELLKRYKHLSFPQNYEVNIVTLDKYCMDNKIWGIDLLWIDAQGAEGDIIEGGKSMLLLTKYLFIEFALNEYYKGQVLLEEMLSMLSDFKVVGVFKENVFLRNRHI